MKRLTVALVVLLGLLLVADRAGAYFAAQAISEQVRASTTTSTDPEVEIGGFPFLTQALSGRYDRVAVTTSDFVAGDVTVQRLETTLTGVRVPLSEALSGSVGQVPVEGVRATALLDYDELARRSGDRGLSVAPVGDRVRVTGRTRVLGQEVSASAVSRVRVEGAQVLVTAESYEVGDQTADALLTRALGDRFDLRIPVQGLPYGLELTEVRVTAQGVAVVARAGETVLVPPG